MSKGITRYSKDVVGTKAVWDRTSRYDMTDGILGISQWHPKEHITERVLLSKAQVDELLKFIGAKRPVRKPAGDQK